MLKSMTGYGRAEASRGTLELSVEVRSGNNRYREIILRLPQSLQPCEDRIRSIVCSRIKRGRIEVSVQMKDNEERGVKLELNRPLVRAYASVVNELNEELGSKQPIDLSFFSQLKDTIIVKQDSIDLERLWPDLRDVLDKALLSLEAMRMDEGKALEKDFSVRLDTIKGGIEEIRNRARGTVEEYRDKLRERINKLIQISNITEDRLMQEVAFVADRSDITEELIRVESHLKQYRAYMNRDDAIGRRLDFLVQEMNREVNTMASKAADSFISQLVVDIKAELERLREQIQNVE
jgi:uncharacterized protein (TIGR00255 family)